MRVVNIGEKLVQLKIATVCGHSQYVLSPTKRFGTFPPDGVDAQKVEGLDTDSGSSSSFVFFYTREDTLISTHQVKSEASLTYYTLPMGSLGQMIICIPYIYILID